MSLPLRPAPALLYDPAMTQRKMKFGVWLPSFAWPQDNTWETARYLKEWCHKADQAGLDIWVIDHLLVAPGLYGSSWLEPGSSSFWAGSVGGRFGSAMGMGLFLVVRIGRPVV